MASDDWAQQQKMLSAAGLLVMGLDAKNKIEKLVDINPLIEAARSSKEIGRASCRERVSELV